MWMGDYGVKTDWGGFPHCVQSIQGQENQSAARREAHLWKIPRLENFTCGHYERVLGFAEQLVWNETLMTERKAERWRYSGNKARGLPSIVASTAPPGQNSIMICKNGEVIEFNKTFATTWKHTGLFYPKQLWKGQTQSWWWRPIVSCKITKPWTENIP